MFLLYLLTPSLIGYELHAKACKIFSKKILVDPTHRLHNGLSSCHWYTSTHSMYGLISSRNDAYWNSTVHFQARTFLRDYRRCFMWCTIVHFSFFDVNWNVRLLTYRSLLYFKTIQYNTTQKEHKVFRLIQTTWIFPVCQFDVCILKTL